MNALHISRDVMARFIDGDGPLDDAARAHLRSCSACASMLQREARLDEELRSIEPTLAFAMDPPASVMVTADGPPRGTREARRSIYVAAAAAAVCVIVALVVQAMFSERNDVDGVTSVAVRAPETSPIAPVAPVAPVASIAPIPPAAPLDSLHASRTQLTREQVLVVVKARMHEVEACASRARFAGRITASWTIEPDGRTFDVVVKPAAVAHATEAGTSSPSRTLRMCVAEAIAKWRFASAEKSLTVTFPFQLDGGLTVREARAGHGRIRIRTTPWATVYVDGERMGDTPLIANVPAGRRRVLIATPDGKQRKDIEVVVEEGKDVTLKFDLDKHADR